MENETCLLNIMVEGNMPKKTIISEVFANTLIEYAEAIKENNKAKASANQPKDHIGYDVSRFKSSNGCEVKIIFGTDNVNRD
jgi:hypothetical protein